MKKTIEKRLGYLYSGELFSIIAFIPVSFLLNKANPELHLYSLYSFWASFILVEFLLLQGTYYWYSKLKRLRNENNAITPLKVVRQLHALKFVNVILIIAAFVVIIFDVIKWYPSLPKGGLTLTFFIYIFAILEFINYFYIQLSYDKFADIKNVFKSRKLKISSLNKDFKRLNNGRAKK